MTTLLSQAIYPQLRDESDKHPQLSWGVNDECDWECLYLCYTMSP